MATAGGGNTGREDVITGVEKVAVPATSHSGHFGALQYFPPERFCSHLKWRRVCVKCLPLTYMSKANTLSVGELHAPAPLPRCWSLLLRLIKSAQLSVLARHIGLKRSGGITTTRRNNGLRPSQLALKLDTRCEDLNLMNI